MSSKAKPKSSKPQKDTSKSYGVNLQGDDVNIGQDVIGGDKVINVKNYYQNPIEKKQSVFPKFKKSALSLIKKPWTWVVLVIFLLSASGLYWKQLQPLSVCPSANGNYIILVAKFEALGVSERNVSRFIVTDLYQKLITQPAPTNFIFCEYPRVIQTNDEALKTAQVNHADIIVWGNYTPKFIEAQVQVGEI